MNEIEIPTPRTDAAFNSGEFNTQERSMQFACQLERENASLKAERERLNTELSNICSMADAHDAAEACEVIRAMREAIKLAHATLQDATDNGLWRSDQEHPLSTDESQRIYNLAIETIAKLQPYLK